MFKSRRRERSIFTTRTRYRRRVSRLWLILAAGLFLLVLELITRIIIDISGRREEFANQSAKTGVMRAYQLQLTGEAEKTDSDIATDGKLDVQRSLSVGYELLGQQESKYWQINEQGFRDRDPVLTTKAEDEVRIFLLGNSTAFGYGNSSNEATISEQLEARLQKRLEQQERSPQIYQPSVLPAEADQQTKALAKPPRIKSGQYRVINAAVPGYASGNELAQLALQILRYKPDLVVVLDGYPDLMLPSSQTATAAPQSEPVFDDSPQAYVGQLLQPLRDKSYLVQMIQDRFLLPEASEPQNGWLLTAQPDDLAQYLAQSETELQQRVERYFQHLKQMVVLCAGARVPLIVAVQPEITGRDPSKLDETEGVITSQIGKIYIQGVKNDYAQFVAANRKIANIFPQNVKSVNLYNLSDKYPTPSFIDAIHLTDEANKVVAEQLYYAIASLPKMQLVPRKPVPKPKKVEVKQEKEAEE